MAITPVYIDKIYYTLDGAYTTLPSNHQYTVLGIGNASGQYYAEYLNNLRNPFIKICRLRFLNPDGSVAFALDNN